MRRLSSSIQRATRHGLVGAAAAAAAAAASTYPHTEAPAGKHVCQERASEDHQKEDDSSPLWQGSGLNWLEVVEHVEDLFIDAAINVLVGHLEVILMKGVAQSRGVL
jgi:hypothetical protein